jgi:hypothetical protein
MQSTKVTKKDAKLFIVMAIKCITRQVNNGHTDTMDFNLDVKGRLECVHEGTLNFIRHNLEWNDFVEWRSARPLMWSMDNNSKLNDIEGQLVWCKEIYDNPKYFND